MEVLHSLKPKALILGVANAQSLAWAIAQELHGAGFEIALTYPNEKSLRRVGTLGDSIGVRHYFECDLRNDFQIKKIFSQLQENWGHLDTLIHSLAYADLSELEGRFSQVSRKGFAEALDISVFSLITLTQTARHLMKDRGGSILTLTYQGSERVVPGYHLMGVAKAALEASVRYLAYDLGNEKIRVNAISSGPVKTLAASVFPYFQEKLDLFESKCPLRENISASDVGKLATFLCTPQARHITGAVLHLDSGAHILGA